MSSEEQARDRRLLTEAARLRGRSWRIVPHPGPVTEQATAAGGKSGALRAGIFGLNDGLVSNLSLIFGVAGAASATTSSSSPASPGCWRARSRWAPASTSRCASSARSSSA